MPRDPRPSRRTLRRAAALVVAAAALAAAAGVVGARRARALRCAPAGTRFGFSQGEFSPGGSGSSVDVAFGDAPAPAGAREHLRALAPAGLRMTMTRWAPADARPAAYPAELPFLAGQEAHTAEYIPNRLTDSAEYAGAAGRNARWPLATRAACDSAFAQLAASSAAEGWRRVDTGSARVDPGAVRYARAGWTRTFLVGDADRTRRPDGGSSAGRWCTVEMADRPAGRDGLPSLPHVWWPYWWDPGSPDAAPPPEPAR